MRCKECGCSEFLENAGFYFCQDCGNQNQDDQVLEYDGYFGGPDNIANTTNIKPVSAAIKAEENLLTSWEEYNFILVGLVDELIDLGAKDELKMTVLQLWTTYLRVNEVAFFSRREPRIPKLGASFKLRDADILYNLKRQKRRKKRSAPSGSGATSSDGASTMFSRRALKKSQRDLARSEYESLVVDRESADESLSALSRSMASDDSSSCASSASGRNVRLEFSRMSRRVLKRKMDKKHLRKHELDGRLECHSFRRSSNARSYHPEIVSRSMVFELLYLGLNQIGDDIQLGDIIRYIREGHLTYTKVSKFFPENVRKQKQQNNFNHSNSVAPSHGYIRFGARQQSHLLHVDVKLPNMHRLTKRYIEELALPPTVHDIVNALLALCPPEMQTHAKLGYKKLPNYEGRAVAMVLFAVKLLFGLDDKRERELSASAHAINTKLDELKSNRTRLFEWTHWMRFVEMRNVILAQCHYPTGSVVDPESVVTDHLVEFMRQQGLDDLEPNCRAAQCTVAMENMRTVFEDASKLYETNAADKSLLVFQPSLTPKRSYLDRLLSEAETSQNVYIPDFMRNDPSKSDMEPFLDPTDLKRFLQTLGIGLRLKNARWNERLTFNPVFVKNFPYESKSNYGKIDFVDYCMDITTADWLAATKERNKMKQDHIDTEQLYRSEVFRQKMTYRKLVTLRTQAATATTKQDEATHSDDSDMFSDDTISSLDYSLRPGQPRQATPQSDDSDDEEDDDDKTAQPNADTLTLTRTNFEHWLCMGFQQEMTKENFGNLCAQLPLNFQWMLRQCAFIVQCHERDVYHELQVLENQYAYVLQSQEAASESVPGMSRLSKILRKYW